MIEVLGQAAHQALEKHIHKVTKHQLEVLATEDSEPIHQMRVGLRRLRTVIQVFGFALDLPPAVSLKRLSEIAAKLGEVRDLDVLIESLETHYQPLLSEPEQQPMQRVIKKLKQRRERKFRRARVLLSRDRTQKLLAALTDWLENPQYQPIADLPLQAVMPDLLLPLISQLLLHPAWLIEMAIANQHDPEGDPIAVAANILENMNHILSTQGDVLHDLRKQVKRVRYEAELFVEFYGEMYSQQVAEWATLQHHLGELNDGVVLQTLLRKQFNIDLSETFPSLKPLILQQQAQFWQTWQPLRLKYLDSTFRQSLRQLVLQYR
jgi:CHAD domain-containing protein